jgi:hypothetical protein
MAAKKSAKKGKGRDRKPAKVGNLPAKALSGDAVRAVKGGVAGAHFQKTEIKY